MFINYRQLQWQIHGYNFKIEIKQTFLVLKTLKYGNSPLGGYKYLLYHVFGDITIEIKLGQFFLLSSSSSSLYGENGDCCFFFF